jgi:hypothetical protein
MEVAAVACDAAEIVEAAPSSDIPIRIAITIFLTDTAGASLADLVTL